MTKRECSLDQMRGLGTLLIIFGHCFQTTYITYPNLLIYQIIYLFHVPLFALISGYLLNGKENLTFFEFAFNRAKRLFFPYIIWLTIIGLVYNDALLFNKPFQFYVRGITTVQTPWFLFILFLTSLIFFFLIKSRKIALIFCFPVLIMVINLYSHGKVLNQQVILALKVLYYTFIIGVGYYLFKLKIEKVKAKYLKTLSIISLILFFSVDISIRKSVYFIPVEICSVLLSIYLLNLLVKKFQIYLSFLNIEWLGKHALELYVIQYLFLIFIPYAHRSVLILITSFFGVTALSICVIKLKEAVTFIYPNTKKFFTIIFGS